MAILLLLLFLCIHLKRIYTRTTNIPIFWHHTTHCRMFAVFISHTHIQGERKKKPLDIFGEMKIINVSLYWLFFPQHIFIPHTRNILIYMLKMKEGTPYSQVTLHIQIMKLYYRRGRWTAEFSSVYAQLKCGIHITIISFL